VNKNRGCIKHVCFDKKGIWIQIPPGKKLVARDALLHTRDACCTLCCGRTAKPLFHEVETVDLWVWFPSMICLGWWAGTTGPPRIPPNQGCEHPSVMSFIPKKFKNQKSATIQKCNVPKNERQQNTLRKWSKFYRSSRCVRIRNFNLKRLDLRATLISDGGLSFSLWEFGLVCQYHVEFLKLTKWS